MENIRLPMELIQESVKNPDLPDYGIRTGDLVIIDQDAKFTEGELSVFVRTKQKTDPHQYRVSREKEKGYKYFGKIAMVMKYYSNSPLNNV